MRILYITPGCFDKGGISRYSRYQISALREIVGSENVRTLSLLGPDEEAFEDGFDVDWSGTSRFGNISMADRISFAGHILKLATLWRPNVVHSAHVNFSPLLRMAGRLSGASTALNVYGLEIWSGLSKMRRHHMKHVSQVIADCHFTARYVRAEGLHSEPSTVIWDPVDLERFAPGAIDPQVLAKYKMPDPGNHLVIMSLGRLAKAAAHKGFDRLIPVVAELAPSLPELRLVIAGRGDDRPRLEELCVACGIADRVVFTGTIDENDLPNVYRCAHIFSLVSDRGLGRGEGIPLTPLEAMACGVPIVVGNEDGSQEAVVDGRNGIVVSPRDPCRPPQCTNRPPNRSKPPPAQSL